MKIKLKKDILKKYGYGLGGDFNESTYIAVDFDGNPILYKDLKKAGSYRVMRFDSEDSDTEFQVIEHNNPIPKAQFEAFKGIFKEITDE